MPNVVRTDIDSVNAVLTVTLPKEEYLDKVKKDIKQYTQRATMKGFRPGKTPPTLVKKMYGMQFLMDAVNERVQAALNDYLDTEKLDMLGQPIPSTEQEKFELDLKDPKDLTFKFDVGLLPNFEVKALKGEKYDRYAVTIDDKMIDEQVAKVIEKGNENKEVDGQIEENDIVTLKIKEVGGTLENEVSVSVNWMTEDMKSVFLTQSKGDSLQINIFQLEKETTPQYARKYFLGLEDSDSREVNENFDATIVKIMRAVKPELNEEFFQKNFGVATEEEARKIITDSLVANYENQADALLLRDIQDRVISENNIELPDSFLKRWLKTQNERNTDQIIEAQYNGFANNMRWTLIRTKVLKDAEVQVTDEDLREHYANKIRGYLGGMMPMDDSFINSLVDRAMADEKQATELYEDVLTEKLFNTMKGLVEIDKKSISSAEFDSLIAAARYEASKARGEIAEETQVEEIEA